MYHRISFGLALRLSVRQFQMILEVLSFVKRWQHLESLQQPIHLYKILLGLVFSVDILS